MIYIYTLQACVFNSIQLSHSYCNENYSEEVKSLIPKFNVHSNSTELEESL